MRNIFRQREVHGAFHTLFQEMQRDREMFIHYHRMSPNRFELLRSLVKNCLTKKETRFCKPISAGECRSVTLNIQPLEKVNSLYHLLIGW